MTKSKAQKQEEQEQAELDLRAQQEAELEKEEQVREFTQEFMNFAEVEHGLTEVDLRDMSQEELEPIIQAYESGEANEHECVAAPVPLGGSALICKLCGQKMA